MRMVMETVSMGVFFSFILRSPFVCSTPKQQVESKWKWKIRVCHHTLPSPAEDLIIGGRRWPHPADLSPVSLPILLLSCPYPCLQVSRYLPWWTAHFLPNGLPPSVLQLSFPDSSLPPTLSLYNRSHCSPSCRLCVRLPVCVPCCSKGCDTPSMAVAWGDLHLRISEKGL